MLTAKQLVHVYHAYIPATIIHLEWFHFLLSGWYTSRPEPQPFWYTGISLKNNKCYSCWVLFLAAEQYMWDWLINKLHCVCVHANKGKCHQFSSCSVVFFFLFSYIQSLAVENTQTPDSFKIHPTIMWNIFWCEHIWVTSADLKSVLFQLVKAAPSQTGAGLQRDTLWSYHVKDWYNLLTYTI